MSIVAIIGSLLKLISLGAEYLGRKQLIDAGEAKAIAQGVTETLEAVANAKKAREALGPELDSERAERLRRKYERP